MLFLFGPSLKIQLSFYNARMCVQSRLTDRIYPCSYVDIALGEISAFRMRSLNTAAFLSYCSCVRLLVDGLNVFAWTASFRVKFSPTFEATPSA